MLRLVRREKEKYMHPTRINKTKITIFVYLKYISNILIYISYHTDERTKVLLKCSAN
jgi:hypothetical protein